MSRQVCRGFHERKKVRCLNFDEGVAILASTPLSGSVSGRLRLTEGMHRVEARPDGDIASLGSRLDKIFRWLPPDTGRLFYLHDWGFGALAQPYSFVMAARQGIGETRPLIDARMHHFPTMSWTWDAQEETEEQKRESGLLAGLVISTMCFGWDAWLVAENCREAIEFWEGNILFYSPANAKLDEARSMLKEFGFPPKMK